MPAPVLLLAALLAAPPPVQMATLRPPARAFGYFIGDRLDSEAQLLVDRRYRLDRASLPAPGALAYWLDLRGLEVDERAEGGAVRYTIRLHYQTFYDPLEPLWLEVPGFAVDFTDGAARAQAKLPGWRFLSSPLRTVSPGQGEQSSAILPDRWPAPHDLRPDGRQVGAALAMAGVAALLLAWSRGWLRLPGARARPFARAARRLRRLPGEAAAEEAFLALHRAFDAAAGRPLLADDLPAFLDRHRGLRALSADIERFFAASRLLFFGTDRRAALASFPPAELRAFCRRLDRRARA